MSEWQVILAPKDEARRKSRRPIDIMARMVSVCSGGAKKTEVMYKSNLSYDMLKRYLRVLEEAGLVENSGRIYRASTKGLAFIRDYEDFMRVRELYDSKKSSLLELVASCSASRRASSRVSSWFL